MFVGVLCLVFALYAILSVIHLHGEERAGCFTFNVFLCLVNVSVLWLFLTLPWIGLQCVIVLFPDHTVKPV